MCGILGGTGKKWNYERALDAIKHRGPDKRDILRDEEIVLGFARLSIIDLSDVAMQPMTSEDGSVTIIYNGEIYGYENLRKKLEQKHHFISRSDTEVILYAYMEYGDQFIDYFDGIFAIAIYDRRNRSIRLFRDRVGVKPLYYYYDGHYFAFASELKAINCLLENANHELDYTALYDYLTYAYIPAPKTMYKSVRQLKPAHKIIYRIDKNQLSEQKRYWKLSANTEEGKRAKSDGLALHLRELLHQSVKEQMVADVPVGTFLSGGMDSSVITYESLLENTDTESFSIGFTDKEYDESKYYHQFVEKFKNNSNEQIFNREIYKELYGELANWYDEPFADTSAFPTWLVSKLAKEKVTVVLTGDGGDELFGGYAWYNASYHSGIWRDSEHVSRMYENLVICRKEFYHKKLESLLCEILQKFSVYHGYETRQMKAKAAKKWGIPEDYDDYWFLREYDHKELPIRTRLQYIDFHTFLPRILTKVDRASMQVSLEARVPFLSRKVIEYAFSLPQEERCPKGEIKYLLRRAYPEIPRSIRYRSKQGFCVPEAYIGRGTSANRKLMRNIWRM